MRKALGSNPSVSMHMCMHDSHGSRDYLSVHMHTYVAEYVACAGILPVDAQVVPIMRFAFALGDYTHLVTNAFYNSLEQIRFLALHLDITAMSNH